MKAQESSENIYGETEENSLPIFMLVICALTILLAFHFFVNQWWLANDNHPLLGDDAQHLQFVRAYHEIFSRNDIGLADKVRSSLTVTTGIYPPLFHIFAAVSCVFLGAEDVSFAVANTVVFMFLILAVYLCARLFFGQLISLYAAFATSFIPLLYGTSRLCLTDLMSCLFVVLSFWALCRTEKFFKTRWVIVFALFTGLGFLVRWITCLYYFAPFCAVILSGVIIAFSNREDESKKGQSLTRLLLNLLIASFIVFAIPAPWYAPKTQEMMKTYKNYFRKIDGASPFAGKTDAPDTIQLTNAHQEMQPFAVAGVIPAGNGTEQQKQSANKYGPFSFYTWSTYAICIINKGVFLPMFLLTILGTFIALTKMRDNYNVFLLMLWFIGSYIIMTLFWRFRAPAPRYMMPLMPALAILSVYALKEIPSIIWRRMAMAIFAVILLFQFGNISFASYGPVSTLEIPVLKDHSYVRFYGDKGLVVYKDTLNAGGALIGPPFKGGNWVDQVFRKMIERELTRHYIGSHQANILLVGINKQAIETVQRDYWPLTNPLKGDSQRVQDLVNPYVLVNPQKSFNFSNAGTTLDFEYETLTELDALQLEFSSLDVCPAEFTVQYLDKQSQQYTDFSPPVHYDSTPLQFQFMSFDTVKTKALKFNFKLSKDTARFAPPADIKVYRYMPQPRPFVLAGSFEKLSDISTSNMATSTYLIIADQISEADEERLATDFEVIDSFEANILGHWKMRQITLMALRQQNPIMLGNTPGLRVTVSGDRYPNGRWDMPWWRQNSIAAIDNPKQLERWITYLPATADVEFGAEYDVNSVEIVPFKEEYGLSEVKVEYLDREDDVWKTLPDDKVRIDVPRRKPEPHKYDPKTYPQRWPVPVRTSRMRLTVTKGGTDPETAHGTFVSYILIYGDRVEPEIIE